MSELRILQLGISPPFQTVIETMSPQVGNRLPPGSFTAAGDIQYNSQTIIDLSYIKLKEAGEEVSIET